MATVKIFDCNGVKELSCFDTLSEIPYLLEEEECEPTSEPEEED